MAKTQTYRAFVACPSHVLDLNGEILDGAPVLVSLASEVRDISGYATYVVRNDEVLGGELARVTATAPAEAGRQAGVTMPDFLATGKSGRSRKEKLVQYNVVTAYRSYQERVKAANGDSSKYVSRGWKNVSMPVDVVLEWAGDATLRQYVLGSPVLPREELVRLLLEGVDDSVDVAAMYAFEPWSNADGQIIDWYVNMWCRNVGSSSRHVGSVGVERALSHPRAWRSTLERAYALHRDDPYGDGIVKSVLRSVSCPDWAWWDTLARRKFDLIRNAVRYAASVPHGFARALADDGKWECAVACPGVPSDVLVDVVEGVINECEWRGEQTLRNMLTDVVTHENMPPEVRRACARWLHKSLRSVARDGFLGRA